MTFLDISLQTFSLSPRISVWVSHPLNYTFLSSMEQKPPFVGWPRDPYFCSLSLGMYTGVCPLMSVRE